MTQDCSVKYCLIKAIFCELFWTFEPGSVAHSIYFKSLRVCACVCVYCELVSSCLCSTRHCENLQVQHSWGERRALKKILCMCVSLTINTRPETTSRTWRYFLRFPRHPLQNACRASTQKCIQVQYCTVRYKRFHIGRGDSYKNAALCLQEVVQNSLLIKESRGQQSFLPFCLMVKKKNKKSHNNSQRQDESPCLS